MNDRHQVPPHENDEITQQINGRVEAIWATVPSLHGVNLEMELRLAEERRKKVAAVNEILGEVAIHLKEYTNRLSKGD